MMNTQMTFLLTMLALSLTSVRGADVPVAMFGQSGGTASLEVKENQDFIIQLSDFTSTGYHWFLDSIVPSSLAKYNGNVTGGGVTGPPYLNASFTAGLGQGKIRDIPPPEPLLEKEHCSVCSMIVENSRKWNWGQHYESLCVDVPPHALSWCMHYVCKMVNCEYFKRSSCQVIRSKETGDTVTMAPCPAKYLCSYCLDVPQTQVFGCFDGFDFECS